MRRRPFHPLIAWLLLLSFGLSNTLLAGGLVVCHDGHGGTRIERGCDRNSSGECLGSCGDEAEEEEVPAHPCQDTLIPADHQVSKAPPRSKGDVTVEAQVLVAVLSFRRDVVQLSKSLVPDSGPDRPPDELRFIRTVILLV